MKFYLHGMFGGVPVVIETVNWDDDIPLEMGRHFDRAYIFDTSKGDDIAELCRIASEYGFTFYAAAVEPQLTQTEFDEKCEQVEADLVEAFGELHDKYVGPGNTVAAVAEVCLRALKALPAFRNQDVIEDLRLEASRSMTLRICIAMSGVTDPWQRQRIAEQHNQGLF